MRGGGESTGRQGEGRGPSNLAPSSCGSHSLSALIPDRWRQGESWCQEAVTAGGQSWGRRLCGQSLCGEGKQLVVWLLGLLGARSPGTVGRVYVEMLEGRVGRGESATCLGLAMPHLSETAGSIPCSLRVLPLRPPLVQPLRDVAVGRALGSC